MLSNCVVVILTWAALLDSVTAIKPARHPQQPTGNGDKLLTFNEIMVDAAFAVDQLAVDWLAGEEDGLVVYLSDAGSLVLENYATGEKERLVSNEDIPEDYWEYWIQPNQEQVLFSTNYTKQYRYSYFADYEVLDVQSGESTPLVDNQAGDIQYAEFAPTGNLIAFVRDNDLYIKNTSTDEITRVTDDGRPDMFNAVPDWVYEEEIFGSRSTFWFSPDAQFLAFLSFNETGVGTFTIPYYMNDSKIAPPYPRELELRYPKVGTTNPTVKMSLLDLSTMEVSFIPIDAYPADDLVIGEVAWVTDTHERLIYRAFNRVQTEEKLVTVSIPSGESSIHRRRDGSDGWLDNLLAISYVGDIDGTDYYLDMSDASGWAHLYLFPVDGSAEDNITLTSGEWEVRSILSIDTDRGYVYFTSTKGHSTESHVYRTSYSSMETEALVDDSVPAYWSASFSSASGFYILSYLGPDVPYQELYAVNETAPLRTVISNSALIKQISNYSLPNITYTEIGPVPNTDYMLNAMIQYPPNFDPTKKYPVLLTPYGGPGAQEVAKTFKAPEWNQYISSDPELEYITYTVDNRGTGYKGRAFRAEVTEKLGVLEARDQIWAAKDLISRYDFVDADHIALWGWSYGGFLTAKTIEAQGSDSGPITLGLITAPVSDWRFYDSMYTERYMRTPALNPDGYKISRVSDVTGFKNIPGGFAIMHGTGDDNVHYQNSAALIDLLVGAGVSPEKADWRAFTDSDHGIYYNGADLYLYKYLTKYLYEEKRRTGMREQHQWSRREVVDLGGETRR